MNDFDKISMILISQVHKTQIMIKNPTILTKAQVQELLRQAWFFEGV